MKLACQLWKPATGSETKIVLLHGMGGTGALWRPVAAALEDDCEVLAPDQRGHGKSRVRDAGVELSYAPLDYGRDVVETLQNLDFHPAWLVGHSMGVRTACAAAHLRPEWVRGLLLIDLGFSGLGFGSLGFNGEAAPAARSANASAERQGLGDALARFLEILPMEFQNRAAAREFMERECPDPAIAQYLMAVASIESSAGPSGAGPSGAGPSDSGGAAHPGALTFPFDKSALIQTIEAARKAERGGSIRDWVRELAERGMPILALRGERSLVWSHEELEADRALFAEFPSVRFEEFANAGHGLPFEQRAAFTRRLREFVGKNHARAGVANPRT